MRRFVGYRTQLSVNSTQLFPNRWLLRRCDYAAVGTVARRYVATTATAEKSQGESSDGGASSSTARGNVNGAGWRAMLHEHRSALTIGGVVLGATWLSDSIQGKYARCRTMLREYFYVTLEIRSHQPEFDALLIWLATQPIGKQTHNISIRTVRNVEDSEMERRDLAAASGEMLESCRSLHETRRAIAHRALARRNGADDSAITVCRRPRDEDSVIRLDTVDSGAAAAPIQRPVTFVPGYGTHRVVFKGHTIWLTREIDTDRKHGPPAHDRSPDEIITLVLFAHDRKLVEELLHEAKLTAARANLDQTPVYIPDFRSWRLLCRRPKRYLSSIYVPESIASTADEVRTFFDQRDVYRGLGIPWRRGYLLTGPPGTGKSSLILALAGEHNLPVYVITPDADMSDEKFLELVNGVPADRSLLVIEDLDTAISGIRGGDLKPKKDETEPTYRREIDKLSLSGVLNALDGISSKEGRVLIVTSNTPVAQLPPALVRPGRVDRVVHFDKMAEAELRRMLSQFGCTDALIATHSKKLAGKVTPASVQAAIQLDGLRCRESTFKAVLS
jgi:chaperone BCS1